jgi:hypothetical protein
MFTVVTEGTLSDEQVTTDFLSYDAALAFALTQPFATIERDGITLAYAGEMKEAA